MTGHGRAGKVRVPGQGILHDRASWHRQVVIDENGLADC